MTRSAVLRSVRLSQVEDGRANNVNLIRFLLASSVIFSHSFVLRGELALEPLHARIPAADIGDLAVQCFFCISGYLILKSAMRWANPAEFLAARVLRIFPGLILVTVLCALVLGPLASSLSLPQYLRAPGTWSFLDEMWMHRMQHSLPGVFASRPYPGVVNGPLWTLPVEWTLYVVTMLACLAVRRPLLPARNLRSFWLSIVVAVALTAQMFPLPYHFAHAWIQLFALGAICYSARRRILLSIPVAAILAVLASLLLPACSDAVRHRVFVFILTYALLTLGFHPALHIPAFHRVGDYSYGLYIYGWPIQQLLEPRFHSALTFFCGCYLLVLPLAILSWHYLEQPALALKRRWLRTAAV